MFLPTASWNVCGQPIAKAHRKTLATDAGNAQEIRFLLHDELRLGVNEVERQAGRPSKSEHNGTEH